MQYTQVQQAGAAANLPFVDAVLLLAALLIAAIIAWAIRSSVASGRREEQARKDLERTESLGVQPPSLHPKIDLDACIGTGACIEACPETNVIALVDGQARLANPTACIGHGECLRACPVDAIRLVLGTERRGVDIPMVASDFQTNVPGLYVIGELGGMGLIYNAMTQGMQCMDGIIASKLRPLDGAHQVLIIGAGPAGMAATVAAKAAGLDAVTVDQESMGGTVLQYPRQKIVMTRPVKLPLYGKFQVTSVLKEDLLAGWQEIAEKTEISIREKVRVDSVATEPSSPGSTTVFRAETSAGTIRAQRVVLAVGRRGTPRKLGVPGEDLAKVAYRLLEPEEYAGKRCMVVGGGDAGVEAAIALGENGAACHLVYRREVFDRIKPKNQERLSAAVEAGRVQLLLKSAPARITEDSVTVSVDGTDQEFPNDFVFIFAGGVLPTAFLEKAGVEVSKFTGEEFAPANQ